MGTVAVPRLENSRATSVVKLSRLYQRKRYVVNDGDHTTFTIKWTICLASTLQGLIFHGNLGFEVTSLNTCIMLLDD